MPPEETIQFVRERRRVRTQRAGHGWKLHDDRPGEITQATANGVCNLGDELPGGKVVRVGRRRGLSSVGRHGRRDPHGSFRGRTGTRGSPAWHTGRDRVRAPGRSIRGRSRRYGTTGGGRIHAAPRTQAQHWRSLRRRTPASPGMPTSLSRGTPVAASVRKAPRHGHGLPSGDPHWRTAQAGPKAGPGCQSPRRVPDGGRSPAECATGGDRSHAGRGHAMKRRRE